jgi:hypothetical protein
MLLKQAYPEKTADLLQVTYQPHHNVASSTSPLDGLIISFSVGRYLVIKMFDYRHALSSTFFKREGPIMFVIV